jgi:hypothetical protein
MDEIACEQCGRREPASCKSERSDTFGNTIVVVDVLSYSAYENLDVKTYSHPNAFPSSLRQKRALVQGHKDDGSRQKDEDPVVSLFLPYVLCPFLHPDAELVYHLSIPSSSRSKKSVRNADISG